MTLRHVTAYIDQVIEKWDQPLPPHPEPPSCHGESPTEANLCECLRQTLEILRAERMG